MNSVKLSKSLPTVCGLWLLTVLGSFEASAALRTWDGGGANNFWLNATNWVGDAAPVAGDDLFFPASAAQPSNMNNFPAGTTFNSLIFSGMNYSLGGNAIALNAGILATNGSNSTINDPIVLNSNQTFTINIGSASFSLPAAIDLNGKDLTFSVTSPAITQVQAVISGAGGLVKAGNGSVSMYTSNSFTGTVQIQQGTISSYNANALGSPTGSTTVVADAFLNLINPGTVPEPILLSGTLSSFTGAKSCTGPITLAANTATIRVTSGAPLTINALISGSAGFTKTDVDALNLNSNNTYTGTTTVSAGILRVNGSQPASPIVLDSGVLGGTGTVGTISANAGFATLAPGGGGSPGILTCSNVALGSSTTFAAKLNNPTSGSGYDQLNVHGTVALGNATLTIAAPNLVLVGGEQFIIINNDGSDTINGTFANLPEGTSVTAGTNQLRITYVGGDGNDVVLTRTAPATRFASITRLGNGHMQLQATGGLSGFAYAIQAASNLNPVVQWSNLGSAPANGSGQFSFTDTNAPLFPLRFYRAQSP